MLNSRSLSLPTPVSSNGNLHSSLAIIHSSFLKLIPKSPLSGPTVFGKKSGAVFDEGREMLCS
jgi:hypothetical protein